jgi:hypothetical protein
VFRTGNIAFLTEIHAAAIASLKVVFILCPNIPTRSVWFVRQVAAALAEVAAVE